MDDATVIPNLAKLRAHRVSDLDICSLPASPTASDHSDASSTHLRHRVDNGQLSSNLDDIHDFVDENRKQEANTEINTKVTSRKGIKKDAKSSAIKVIKDVLYTMLFWLKNTHWAAVFLVLALIAVVAIIGGWSVMAIAGVAPSRIELSADFWNLAFKANIVI